KEIADQRNRKSVEKFVRGDRALLSSDGITPTSEVNLGANLLVPRFIGPFDITRY
ncbi:hypothetical protein PPTG_23466, partial [Phytophthora nicotianae INRA-310]